MERISVLARLGGYVRHVGLNTESRRQMSLGKLELNGFKIFIKKTNTYDTIKS